jgi:UDP-N-acetylmuramate dehydrogenase
MNLLRNVSLKKLNTFGIDARADFFTEISSVAELQEVVALNEYHSLPLLVLGGGSNILLTDDFRGLVLKINFKGIEEHFTNEESVLISVAAGESWSELVAYCVKKGYGGLENLSLIPGSVGAAPMQNIGAYGTELKDTFAELEAFDLHTGNMQRFLKPDCNFGYRYSIFKNELKNRFIITKVVFSLSLKPALTLSYPALQKEIADSHLPHDLKSVAAAVIRIRQRKLPDPETLGNAGSFFKNPVIAPDFFSQLKSRRPDMPYFADENGGFKIPAAWLIEQCGWKGFRQGDAGVHHLQPLVLVNHGTATGKQILQLATEIRASVYSLFGISLEQEVNVV